jgi:hypothetical protein
MKEREFYAIEDSVHVEEGQLQSVVLEEETDTAEDVLWLHAVEVVTVAE